MVQKYFIVEGPRILAHVRD